MAFRWAPLVTGCRSRCSRGLGRRRSWLLLAQLVVGGWIMGMAWLTCATHWAPRLVPWPWHLIGYAKTSRSTCFRIESADANQYQGCAGGVVYQTGYRLAMIWAAPVLWIADCSEVAPALGGQAAAYQNGASMMASR